MASPDELEQMVAAGLVTAGQADGARRVDDDIAVTALGKLVCIGLDARTLLPGYAQTFGLAAASDDVFARTSRPPLPPGVIDGLAALPAAPTWGNDGMVEVVVTSATNARRLVELALPAHRILVGDEPRVAALLDRVIENESPNPPAKRESSGSSPKAERFLARPVREVDRRGVGLNDPSASSIVIQPFGAPPPSPMAAPFGAPAAPLAGPVDAPFGNANPFASAVNANASPMANPFASSSAPPPAPPPAAAPFPSDASLDVVAPAKRAPAPGAPPSARGDSGPHAAAPAPAQARERSREVERPEPKRGPPIAAILGGVVVVAVLAVGGVMAMKGGALGGGESANANKDARSAALDEAHAKERSGDFAWAIAGYSRAADDPRRDDDTADALLGRARCNIALGDRESAIRDIDQVTNGAFASAAMKEKAEALRASIK